MVSLYEAGEFIRNRLDNLMQTTTIGVSEIWCINANSPDPRDDSICKEYPVKYVKLDNRVGVYAAWNLILQNSTSKYVTNANADDLVAPNCYEILMAALDADQRHDFAYPSWHVTRVPNQQWGSLHDHDNGGSPGNFAGCLDRAGVGHFPLWRRSLHEKIGLFDESFKAAGDAEWWMRAYYKAHAKFLWINQFLGCYLYRDGQNLWQREITSEEWARLHDKINEYRGA